MNSLDNVRQISLIIIAQSDTQLERIGSQRTFATAFHINISKHIQFFQPATPTTARQALVSERILPLHRDTGRLIVEKFWNGPEHLRDSINGEPRRSMPKSISLHNYPLHIGQVEALGLPADEYASAMADALATQEISSEPCHLGTRTFTSGVLGPHALWILDFDCCKKLPMSVDGVRLAAERFWRHDPFYPNPDAKCEKDTALW
ncbi:hypothetical protein B0H63DRAFT_543684 [Podospora didyma]|uniref:DUF3669 domain-containing protein n=1 Tax=Podospora didyma TaxID=330526 RepID=A0AAE0NPL2_9PEZI|nr:hypothetical protein B0H63DRAFT_543684 [Podospora didyma]